MDIAPLTTVAAYIDLNPVRAEIVENPAEYRYCSYASSMGGNKVAITGYQRIYGSQT